MAATSVRSRGVQTQPSIAFRLKCDKEFQKLQNKLDLQLKNDLNRFFENPLHSDFTFITDTDSVPVHLAILHARAPLFYEKLQSANQNSDTFQYVPQVDSEKLKFLLRKIYTSNTVKDEEHILIESMFKIEELNNCSNMTENETANLNGKQDLSPKMENMSESYENSNSETDCTTANNNNRYVLDDSGIDDFLPTNAKKLLSDSDPDHDSTQQKSETCLISSFPISGSMNGSTGSDSMFANETCTSLTSDSNFGLLNYLESDQNGGTETEDTLDHEGAGSEESDDKVRTLIRRDTFDLIDPSLTEDDMDKSERDDFDITEINDGDSHVVWEVGGDVLPKFVVKENKLNTEDVSNEVEEINDVMVTSTLNGSSGSDNNPVSSETPTKEEGFGILSASTSTDGGVSLSNSFTATMYRSTDDVMPFLPVPIENLNAIGAERNAVENSAEICDFNKGVRPKELSCSLCKSPLVDSIPKPEEIIYLDSNNCHENSELPIQEINEKNNYSPVNAEWSMKHSNSKLFSPDSIISDRSPLLEKVNCFTQNTVKFLPILTDYDVMNIQSEAFAAGKQSPSVKSSDSVSPEADSLNIEPAIPISNFKKSPSNMSESDMMMNNPIIEVDELAQESPRPEIINNVAFENNCRSISTMQKAIRAEQKSSENIPILSGFTTIMVDNANDSKPSSLEANAKPGSFFVFIDVNGTDNKPSEPRKIENIARRRRMTSGTSEDESLSVNRSISMDTSRKDSYSEDDTQSDRSSKLGTSPKTPTSVYMYIEAGSSPKSVSTKRSNHVRRPSQELSSSPSAKGHIRKLSHGQEPLYLNNPEPIEKAKIVEPVESKVVPSNNAEPEEVLSSEQDDDVETVYSEFSECSGKKKPSSVTSPDDEYSSLSQVPCSKLGEDLLRMFQEEINTDVVVRVNGRDIKAHKCILSSRCSYFAAMLSGGWVESSGNIISLQGFGYTTVHFALCHIYSGATSVPKDVDITELASIADMMGLEGLKDVVALTLKARNCHFFHKPCSACIAGVIECLSICSSFGLEELYEKCIRWLTRYMARTWPTKAFATLPDELLNKCYQAAKAEITVESVLDTIMVCDKLMATLPHVKWAEPVFGLSSKLLEACTLYLAKNLHSVLTSKNFLALGKGQSWNVNALEDTFMSALENLTSDSACLSYVTVAVLLGAGENKSPEESELIENFVELLQKIQRQIERFLIHNANRVVHCQSWSKLTPEMQKRIKDAAVIVFEFGKPTAPPPRLTSLNRRFNRGKTHSPAERSESSTTSSSSGHTTGSRRLAHSTAVSVSKTSTYPLPSRMAITPPAPKLSGFHSKKSPMDSQRSLTPNYEARKESSLRESLGSKLSLSSTPIAGHHAEFSTSQLRKSVSRERVVSGRPKSWPSKEKAPLIKNKDTSRETKPSGTSVTLRSNVNARMKSSGLARPRSAVFSSETSSVEVTRPARSLTSSSLMRDTKSTACKKQTNETQDNNPSKSKAGEKPAKSHGSNVKKSHARDEGKIQHTASSSRRTTERCIKAASGNKG